MPVSHFGKDPGVSHSHTKSYVRSKERKFEKACGRRNRGGFKILLRGPKNAREAVRHFGKAPGVPHKPHQDVRVLQGKDV